MHAMCCNNSIIQCIPFFHRSVWKTVFSNILHTLPHPDLLFMSSCPSIFFLSSTAPGLLCLSFQYHLLSYTLLLVSHVLFYLVRLAVPFPSVVLHM
ncbi:hypothetical protein E2C01_025104 [Portunus trituberculatus]|uniref:Uncharacterized protein n=1 Tax=Portunus trituberculatus TaxID=210409 RepID=A0A5B7EEP6_PORTR|nr:hypothetical protein [Portunus trituberculatus]